MSCPFCETFTCYRRQTAQRCHSDTFSMSEENARQLVRMATQIRRITRGTLQRVDNEAVPTILCDLLDGLAEGLIQELRHKLAYLPRGRDTTAPISGAGTPTLIRPLILHSSSTTFCSWRNIQCFCLHAFRMVRVPMLSLHSMEATGQFIGASLVMERAPSRSNPKLAENCVRTFMLEN